VARNLKAYKLRKSNPIQESIVLCFAAIHNCPSKIDYLLFAKQLKLRVFAHCAWEKYLQFNNKPLISPILNNLLFKTWIKWCSKFEQQMNQIINNDFYLGSSTVWKLKNLEKVWSLRFTAYGSSFYDYGAKIFRERNSN
jgi:hypothetical protein